MVRIRESSGQQLPEAIRRFEMLEDLTGVGPARARFLRWKDDQLTRGSAFDLYDPTETFELSEGDYGWCSRSSDAGRWEVIGPDPCCCVFARDSGRRGEDSTDLGSRWTEEDGDWEIASNQIVTEDDNALLIHNTANPDGDANMRVTASVVVGAQGQIVSVILGYKDADEFYFAEYMLSETGYIAIGRADGVLFVKEDRDFGAGIGHSVPLDACIMFHDEVDDSDDRWVLSTGSGDTQISQVIEPPAGSTKAGLAVVDAASATVAFVDFKAERTGGDCATCDTGDPDCMVDHIGVEQCGWDSPSDPTPPAGATFTLEGDGSLTVTRTNSGTLAYNGCLAVALGGAVYSGSSYLVVHEAGNVEVTLTGTVGLNQATNAGLIGLELYQICAPDVDPCDELMVTDLCALGDFYPDDTSDPCDCDTVAINETINLAVPGPGLYRLDWAWQAAVGNCPDHCPDGTTDPGCINFDYVPTEEEINIDVGGVATLPTEYGPCF